jgi:N-formylglutamate amidohydrolase
LLFFAHFVFLSSLSAPLLSPLVTNNNIYNIKKLSPLDTTFFEMSSSCSQAVIERLGDTSTAFVIAAPHGGTVKPNGVPRRKQGCMVSDSNSDRLAAELRLALSEKLQADVALVSAKWHRSRCDMNRSLKLAADSEQGCDAWQCYHDALTDALQKAVERHGFALLLDIHGQSHRAVTELGYCLSSDTLMLSDDALNALDSAAPVVCSLRTIVERSSKPVSEWVRGESSFGAQLHRHGFFSVPSPLLPNPESQPIRVLASSRDGLAVVIGPGHQHVHSGPTQSKQDRAAAAAVFSGVQQQQQQDGAADDEDGDEDDDSLCCCRFAAASCCCSIYFSGGYTTRHYSAAIKGVVAIQLETPAAVRRNDDIRQSFADAVALAALDFIDRRQHDIEQQRE